MLFNYLKTTLRGLRNNRLTALINIMSLAIGMAAVMAIFFYVRHEWQMDTQHEDADRIYRLVYDERAKIPNGRYLATTSPPMGPALVRDYPEVEQAVRLRYTDDVILSRADVQHYENGLVYADPGFFDLFEFPLAQGDPQTALQAPNSIVLSPQLAQEYFGHDDPIGESVLLDGETSLTVTGVLADQPRQTHLNFDGLISFSTFRVPFGYPVNLESWGWVSFHTYLLLSDPSQAPTLSAKLDAFVHTYMTPERAARASLALQPLRDIYFHSGTMLNAGHNAGGNLIYVYGLSILAILLLVVAGFNYMNIATARSIRKGKEVGLRKVMGARRSGIIWQFVSESVIIAVLSLAIGFGLFEIGKPYLFQTLALDARPGWSDYAVVLPVFVLLAILLGILAGLYPAIVQSRFATIAALKGQLKSGQSSLQVRKLLIITQFIVTSALIAGTLLVQQQMDFVRNKSLGFAKEEVIGLQMQTPDFLERYPRASQMFEQLPDVAGVSAGDLLDGNYGSVPVVPAGYNPEELSAMHILGTYYDYFHTLGIDMVAGRDFSMDHATDTSGLVLNQAAVTAFGWTPEEALGKSINVNGRDGQVIGVTEDFHFKSLHDPIQPIVALIPQTRMEHFILRIKTDDLPATLTALQETWQSIAPELPFDFTFINEAVDQRYRADERFFALIRFFSLLAILLACMGLYGLIATVVAYRLREIGVRKVLGATVWQINTLLSRQFLLSLLLANLIAVPLAVWGVQQWLENFTYQVPIGWQAFALAALVTMVLAILSISRHTLQAARSNPVDTLRNE